MENSPFVKDNMLTILLNGLPRNHWHGLLRNELHGIVRNS
jgi:hypothetical protein